ncbi:50S ribosomal protein L35 [bacterium]|nr:50S ribosomal protein L35 [bacterium]
MPKLKTKKSAAKRFRCSASGKIIRNKAGKRHFLSSKGTTQKRRLAQKDTVDASDHKRIKELIPYK